MTALDGYALQLLDDWLAGPNNGRGGPFSSDALDGYERDVRSWLTFCAAEDIDCWATGPSPSGAGPTPAAAAPPAPEPRPYPSCAPSTDTPSPRASPRTTPPPKRSAAASATPPPPA